MLSTLRASRVSAQRAISCMGRGQYAAHLRTFSAASPAVQKLNKKIVEELQYEKDNYETPKDLAKLPKEWKLTDTPGDVNIKLEKVLDNGRNVRIEWQLVSPFDPELEGFGAEGQENEETPEPQEETNFEITIESKDGEKGMTYFCNTQQGEGHRFIVGNVKTWTATAERDNVGAYNGPDFEDLDDKLQEAMDEFLGEVGVTDEVFDFIDASAVDKEHREYMRWLENLNTFMKG